jgi:hypothetical protein
LRAITSAAVLLGEETAEATALFDEIMTRLPLPLPQRK